jgi:hypothetical protein
MVTILLLTVTVNSITARIRGSEDIVVTSNRAETKDRVGTSSLASKVTVSKAEGLTVKGWAK